MENNNWYNNASGGNASYSSDGGYNNGESKKRGGVTVTQFIVWLLVVAIICGAGGIYLARYINPGEKVSPESGPMIVDKPGSIEESEAAGSSDDAAGETPTTHASEKLNIAASDPDADAAAGVVKNCMASVVGIYIGSGNDEAAADGSEQSKSDDDTGSGSGVIVTSDGYIVTNNHVVSGVENIHVYLQDGTKYTARVVGADSYSDLAVIKIEAANLPAAVLGNSSGVTVGETVYAIGNPLGVLTSSVSRGIISGLDRTITVDGVSMTLMQTDAAVNPGNSGGGLFNSKGELIGIVNAKSASVTVEGLGFAIPIDSAKPVVVDLIDLGYVTGRPYIGITMQDVSLRYGNNNDSGFNPFSFYLNNYVTRVQVMSVEKGSAAETGGMLVNDIVTALDGSEITGSSQFAAKLYEYKVGDTVTITVLRGNESIDLSITLGERS